MVLVQVIKKKRHPISVNSTPKALKISPSSVDTKQSSFQFLSSQTVFFFFFQEMSFKTLGNQYRTVASFGHLKKTHFMSVTPLQKALDKQGWDTKAEDFSATIFRQPCRQKIISSNFYPARPIFLCPEMSFKTPLRRINPGLREIPAAAITL